MTTCDYHDYCDHHGTLWKSWLPMIIMAGDSSLKLNSMPSTTVKVCLLGWEVVHNHCHLKHLCPGQVQDVNCVIEHAANHVQDCLVELLCDATELWCVRWSGFMDHALVQQEVTHLVREVFTTLVSNKLTKWCIRQALKSEVPEHVDGISLPCCVDNEIKISAKLVCRYFVCVCTCRNAICIHECMSAHMLK